MMPHVIVVTFDSMLESPKPKSTRILQISDLHFGDHDEVAVNRIVQLAESLGKETKLDYIIVTGDLQNHFFKGATAVKALLGRLEPFCDKLLVIPGNHDYLIQGFVDRRGSFWGLLGCAALFPFAPWAAAVIAVACAASLWLPQWLFSRRYKKWWKGPDVVLDKENGLLLALLDSNSIRSTWARGRVGIFQLGRLTRSLAELQETEPGYDKLVKIAVMHHHPLPAIKPEKAMGPVPGHKVDEMLLLDDAAEVLRTLADARFDVILHGHKHRAGVGRLDMEQGDGAVRRQLLVVACGTSCINNEMPFSANLLTVLPTRHVVLKRYFAIDAQAKRFEPAGEPVLAATYPIAVRAKEIGYRTAKSAFSFEIDEDGDSFFVQEMADLTMTVDSPPPLGKFGVKPACGTIEDPKFSSDELKGRIVSQTNDGFIGEFEPWKPKKGQKASARLSYWMMGGWVLDCDEARLVQGEKATDTSGCTVVLHRPTDSFEMSVQLPDCCPTGRPRLEFFSGGSEKPVRELDGILDAGLLWSKDRNFIGVKLNDPPLGTYQVIWDLPEKPIPKIDDVRKHAEAQTAWKELRAALLAMGPGRDPKYAELKASLRLAMESAGPLLGKELGEDVTPDRFEVSLMVYDEGGAGVPPGLRVVAHNGEMDDKVRFPPLPIGTGMAGRACKLAQPLVYSQYFKKLNDKPVPYLRVQQQKQHEVLYSLPIPSEAVPSLNTGIVLNVGAYKNGGPLLPGKDEKWDELAKKIHKKVEFMRRMIIEAWTVEAGEFKG